MKFSTASLAAVLSLCTFDAFAFTTHTQTNFARFDLKNSKQVKHYQPLYSSTLDKEDIAVNGDTETTPFPSSDIVNGDDGKEQQDENGSESSPKQKLVVSANHLVIDGRITEGGLLAQAAMPNDVQPIIFEEENSRDSDNHRHHNVDVISTNSHDTIPSRSRSPNQNPSLSYNNNINNNIQPKEEDDDKKDKKIPTSVKGIKMASAATSSLSDLKSKEDKAPKVKAQQSRSMESAPDNNKAGAAASGGATFSDRLTNSGVASAAAMATAAVNAAVAMKSLEAPDVTKSYISLDKNKELDGEGLPLVYDKEAIETYWKKERGALNKRWGYFVGKAVPFLTRLTTLFIKDGKIDEKYIPELSEQARIDLQDLGPTFIKAGQMMSVRPDVLPQPTLDELTKLQDAVVPFSTTVAVQQIESELGGPLGQFFTSISEEPVAAASLAQVYLATLNDGKDTRVAIKVQRPDVLSTVSKDLYVLRRAAEVFQGLVERFAPQQKTNYVALLNEWSIGFYTELDFQNEARNQQRLRDALKDNGVKGVTVPRVYPEMCTRRVLVSEWMDGCKLSQCSDEEIGTLIPICQEAFLTQLFQVGL